MKIYKFFKVYHLVEKRLWPFSISFGFLSITLGSVNYWYNKKLNLLLLRIFIILFFSIYWWKDVLNESLFGLHKYKVYYGLQLRMIFFILSEIFFFISFFWSFFHVCWSTKREFGYKWPPIEFNNIVIDPFSIPLLNTLILLSSGVRITLSHHSIIKLNYTYSILSLLFTSLLGFYFLYLQLKEYMLRFYSIKSTYYGTVFFLLTGFHGIHVTVGAVFLFVCLIRLFFNDLNSNFHVGFECAAWYWHFVDVVWIFLFFCLYWYGFYF